ncbi:aldehyde dehydrogenase iron-sulfur subunit PaoA [Comamonas endophytica]|uniref:Aldehyde dehydrogenase iron-sulfur subunit n=1 Tax=Comamonas endophytica TaxID=2949090 RepID=A0ABY6GGP2_9BURK|nr:MULTISPECIES: aldehyde dehydrogenase iron-sulfur subunit PaoA [unclassified Acidovorax]MCD2513382.1 aldehyde dehydrogenase iron-sulfur subunit [Acidovorax sp. D4N7]UYG53835.1 aldehyde dehydrogenase iron-sulfur subunit [Acidovorax sp. 5MLIR]
MNHPAEFTLSRRGLLQTGAVSLTVPAQLAASAAPASAPAAPAENGRPGVPMSVHLKVNGKEQRLAVDPRTTLLDALREHLHLTGTKKGCDHGQCGACTVIVNGRRINSCLTLAVMQEGSEVTTIEGLGQPGQMHPLQEAFVKHDGYQCGYCTPGQICSAAAVLQEVKQGIPSHVTADLTAQPLLSAAELRERMSGNICRCGAYSNIIDAISEVGGVKA